MDRTRCSHQLRSEERKSTRRSLLKRIPLLRTEPVGSGLAVYKHATPNGVKTEVRCVRHKRIAAGLLFSDRLLKQVAN